MSKTRKPNLDHIHAGLRALAVPIETLVLDAGNARVHDERNLAAIRESLRQFGFRSPVVVQREGRIVRAGNGRCVAARALGWTHVPALLVDDTSREAMLYALADNRTAELATWDEDRLAEILEELRIEQVDTGYLWSPGEVEEALRQTSPAASAAQAPEKPQPIELPRRPTTKPGQLITLGRHRLFCGDSTKAADVRRVLGNKAPELMVTDPPYGVEYEPEWRNQVLKQNSPQTGKIANDDRASWTGAWSHFPGAVAYVWHAGLFSSVVARSLEAVGMELRAQIVWVKKRFAISRGAYHWRHEPAWYAVRKGLKACWTGGRKQDTVWGNVMDEVAGNAGDRALFACKVSEDSVYAFSADSTTVWELPNDAPVGGGHSTQKPIEAMARPMRNHQVERVYDPFLGTGTTLVAAEQEGRQCFGLELNPAYCDVIVRRWEQMTGERAKRQS